MIDFVRKAGIQVTQRVVGESSEMQDGVDADEIAGLRITKILVQTGDVDDVTDEAIVGEENVVEASQESGLQR